MGVTLERYNGHENVVHVDGRVIKQQLLDGPIIANGLVKFTIFYDKRLICEEDVSSIPYQARPAIIVEGNEDTPGTATLTLKYDGDNNKRKSNRWQKARQWFSIKRKRR